MSKVTLKKLTCPNCGKEIEIEIHDSFSSDTDPDGFEKIKNKEEVNITCPHCKKTSPYYHPVLYNDVEHKVMIQFDPYYEHSKQIIDQFELLQSKYVGLEDYKLRVTDMHQEFIEKIFIFKQGYNDISMEYYKVSLLDSIPDNTKMLFYYINDNNEEKMVAALDDGEVKVLSFDKNKYLDIDKAFKSDPIYQRSDNYIVNFNLIRDLIKDPNSTPLHYEWFKD